MIDLDPTFDQQFLNVAVGQALPQVPADRDDDHLRQEPKLIYPQLSPDRQEWWAAHVFLGGPGSILTFVAFAVLACTLCRQRAALLAIARRTSQSPPPQLAGDRL